MRWRGFAFVFAGAQSFGRDAQKGKRDAGDPIGAFGGTEPKADPSTFALFDASPKINAGPKSAALAAGPFLLNAPVLCTWV
jgi:hypothetical protein